MKKQGHLLVVVALTLGGSACQPRPLDRSNLKPFVLSLNAGNIKNLVPPATEGEITDFAGDSLLHLALFYKRDDLIAPLLELGYHPDAPGSRGFTPLVLACMQDNRNAIRQLLPRSKDVNAAQFEGFTALHLAAKSQNKEAVEALIQAGAHVNARNLRGETPLWRQLRHPRPDRKLTEFLISKGADLHVQDVSGVTPLALVRKHRWELEKTSGGAKR